MSNQTDRYRLIEASLGESLADWVSERRRPGVRPPAGWRDIAAELSERTGETVSYESLRQWFADRDPAGASR